MPGTIPRRPPDRLVLVTKVEWFAVADALVGLYLLVHGQTTATLVPAQVHLAAHAGPAVVASGRYICVVIDQ